MNYRSLKRQAGWIAVILASLAACLLPGASARADTCEAPVPDAPLSLVFADEFDGNQLDRNRWNTEFLWGPGVVINRERQYYVNEGQFGYDPFSVENGALSITAIKTVFDRSQLYLTRSIYGPNTVELLWRVPEGAVRYLVYRDGALIGEARGGAYLDRDLREGIDYAYRVVALDAFDNELVTAELTVNTDERPLPPVRRPFSLRVKARLYSSTSGEVTWDPPNRAARYEVYRDGELRRQLEGQGYSSLSESGLARDRVYDYRVVAYDRCDDLIIEDRVTLDTGAAVIPPDDGVARLVIGLRVYSDSDAEIAWNGVRGARRYTVEEGGANVQDGDGRSLFVDDLVPGRDRRFRVTAYDADGNALDSTTRVINTADNSFALNRQAFLSGIITSYKSFRFLYGRAEARVRFPAGRGFLSAFWLLNAYYDQDQPEDPEIDVIEAIGDQPNTAFQTYHVGTDRDGDGFYTNRRSIEQRAGIDDLTADFHTYAVDWSPGRIVWYVDGVETNRYEGDDVSDEQMYLIANVAVGGPFPGPPDATTPFPASMEIDWIRVYQRLGAAAVP